MWNPVYIFLALKDQLPLKRFFRNFFVTGNAKGLFHPRSHFRDDGQPKMGFNTKKTVTTVAETMSKKYGVHFSNYRCIWCGKYHLGKNRENK